MTKIGIRNLPELMKKFLNECHGDEKCFKESLEKEGIGIAKQNSICNFLLAEIRRNDELETQTNPARRDLGSKFEEASSNNG